MKVLSRASKASWSTLYKCFITVSFAEEGNDKIFVPMDNKGSEIEQCSVTDLIAGDIFFIGQPAWWEEVFKVKVKSRNRLKADGCYYSEIHLPFNQFHLLVYKVKGEFKSRLLRAHFDYNQGGLRNNKEYRRFRTRS